MMRLRANVTQVQQRGCSKLAFDREEVVLRVRNCVPWWWRCHSRLRQKLREIEVIRIARRVAAQSGERQGKRIAQKRPMRRRSKGFCEERRSRASVTQT